MKIRNQKSLWGISVIIIALLMLPIQSNAKTKLKLRPHLGIGVDKNKHTIKHFGGRIQLPASITRSYGVEFTNFVSDMDDFTVIGIVLEQRVSSWFHMAIGSVGYFNYKSSSNNAPGLITNLGWEPPDYGNFKPFITFRSDFIFDKSFDDIHQLSVGENG